MAGRPREPVTMRTTCVLIMLAACAIAPAQVGGTWSDIGITQPAIAPTPIGDGHLGELASGTFVNIRFPVPADEMLFYGLNLGNIVGFTGKGASYQLILRRDAEDGPIIHEGPVIAVGDEWNAANRAPVDVTASITAEDRARGWIDIFATGVVEGDDWTMYLSNPGRREVTATFITATPEILATMRATAAMRDRGVAVIPMPQSILLDEGDLQLPPRPRIVLAGHTADEDRFAAEDLADQLAERAGLKPSVAADAPGIVLELVSPTRLAVQARRLDLDLPETPAGTYLVQVADTVHAWAADSDGLFYAAQTIAQLVTPDGTLPRCQIADWPAYPVRGLQYDVARGQTVEVDWWKRVIRDLARCKLNMLVVYGEDDYAFERYPFLGREGTFTPEKAKLLSEYAHRYHMQLVPQFESLGHAGAVLRHEELADLREAGGSWVFCTSEPKVWEFLDNIYAELTEQFPYAEYIHVGGDEFESGFHKCERCREKSIGELYAEHMNKLNALCRKHDRTMLFWPSHRGPTDELSYMSVKYIDMLDKDCIPTEWIYHGPSTYPQIEQYQDLGFEDCWVSPAVVCFSRLWPDYRTTWRGIRGFHRAGHERGVKGCMTTTWEWRNGGIVSNSLPGMFYAAECAWSLGATSVGDYLRRYAALWYGDPRPEAGEELNAAVIEPWPREGRAAVCYNSRLISGAWSVSPRRVRLEYALKSPLLTDAAAEIIAANEQALARLESLRGHATRNADLLDYAEAVFRAYIFTGHKLQTLDEAATAWSKAAKTLAANPSACADALTGIAADLRTLAGEIAPQIALYTQAAEQLGADRRDVEQLTRQRAEFFALADEVEAVAAQARAGVLDRLPPGAKFGLHSGAYTKVGEWSPEQMSEEGAEVRLDLTGRLTGPGAFTLEWQYTHGAHGVNIDRTTLLMNGEPVSVDEHAGWAGAGSRDNLYQLSLDKFVEGAKYEVVGFLRSSGGTDSRGDVWLIIE